MRDRVAPGRIVDPGPAPGIDPGPVAVAIRRPARGHPVRGPDGAVVGIDSPDAAGIELFVADHLGRYVARGERALAAAVALEGPAIELVVAARPKDVVVAQIGAVEPVAAPRIDAVRAGIAVDLGLAAPDHHRGCVVAGVDLDPIVARAAQDQREIGRGDLNALVRRDPAHAQLQRALGKLDLRDPVVEIEHRHAGARTEADRGAADLHLGAGIGACPEAIAGGQRPIDRRLQPIGLTGGREAHRTARIAEPRRPRRRLGRGQAAQDQQQDADEGACRSAGNSSAHGCLPEACGFLRATGVPAASSGRAQACAHAAGSGGGRPRAAAPARIGRGVS